MTLTKTTGREHPENGIKLDDALPTKIAGQKSSQQYFICRSSANEDKDDESDKDKT